jgi:peptide/nickel transport system substrate-binding protein
MPHISFISGGRSMAFKAMTIAAGLLAAPFLVPAARAQSAPPNTLVMLRAYDADNYDPAKSTARSAGEVAYMLADTLTSIDWDMKTVKPGLATKWTVSEDGKTYTFTLRDDVTFCDGRRMTADDVVYSLKRFIDPATRSPVRWRAGQVKEIRATSPTTVEYELSQPYSELPFQLALFFMSIVDKNSVETLGANFGVQGFNGTGPFCWVSWTPRGDFVMKKHEGYNWGPPIFNNPAPQVDRVIWRVIPDDNTRLAALQSGQGDATQYIPYVMLDSLKRTPGLRLVNQPNYFWDYFLGFKVDKPAVNDAAMRRAIVMAVNRPAIAKAVFFGAGDPADSYLNPQVLDFDPESKAKLPGFDPVAARKVLDEAGWVPGSDGIRVKDGVRASFNLYGISDMQWSRMSEAIQADLRRVGVELKVQLWDATVAWGKLATQEFGAFVMSYPYVSAGDALSLYFASANTPTPNRMNWKDADTDKWLLEARTSIDPEARRVALANVQRQVTEANVWIPLVREQLWVASARRVQGVRAHGIYGVGVYKGLDITVGK